MKTITVTSVTLVDDALTVEGTVATDTSFAAYSRATSVSAAPAGNSQWTRTYRLTNNGLSVKRIGVQSVIIPLESLGAIAVALEEELSFPPTIATQPASAEFDTGDAAAELSCVWASELTLSVEKWQYLEWDTDHYVETWVDVPTPDSSDSTAGGLTTTTLAFTAGSGVYLDKTKFRLLLTNSQGSATSNEAVLTVVTPP